MKKYLFWGIALTSFVLFVRMLALYLYNNDIPLIEAIPVIIVALFSVLLIVQNSFNLFSMLYAWEDPEDVEKNKSPKEFAEPKFSFSAIIPARDEADVIKDTLRAVDNISYPRSKREAIVVCRSDDIATIKTVEKAIDEIGDKNLQLVVFSDEPINKPHGLNVGLRFAKGDVVVIFDAEDEPHKDIYNVANTIFSKDSVDVIQSGVQLMNHWSSWFSTLNVLEYFFWFKSSLQLFSRLGTIPLGGNTVFFKKNALDKVGGWDETCLTEDADIGIRLTRSGAKVRVVYDEKHTTQEEVPPNLKSFIKQRTRWDQGFLQVLVKKEWLQNKSTLKKVLAFYLLCWPTAQAVLFIYALISLFFMFEIKMPLVVSMLSIIPLYLLLVQVIIANFGMYEFAKSYKQKYSIFMPIKIFITFYPYQLLLGFCAFRAMVRLFFIGDIRWEKTKHTNAHRKALQQVAI